MLRTCLFVLACSLSLPAVLAGTNAFGKKFLEENKARAGVTTLPSGLQYRVLRDGDGECSTLPCPVRKPTVPYQPSEEAYSTMPLLNPPSCPVLLR